MKVLIATAMYPTPERPFFGTFVHNLMIERLLTTLSTLIESGVSILKVFRRCS